MVLALEIFFRSDFLKSRLYVEFKLDSIFRSCNEDKDMYFCQFVRLRAIFMIFLLKNPPFSGVVKKSAKTSKIALGDRFG